MNIINIPFLYFSGSSKLFVLTTVLILSVIIHFNCSEEPTAPSKEENNNDGFTLETTATIGAGGGTVSSDEFSLIVPAGSFNQQAELKLYSKIDSSLFGENTATKLFRIEGMPSNFTSPLRIALKYDQTIENSSSIAISEDFVDDYTDEAGIIYDFNDATDSSGFLVGFLEPPSDNSIIYPLQYNKVGFSNEENNILIQGNDNILTLESENFSIKFPSSYGQSMLELSTILEKNYAIIKDTLNLVFSKDSNSKWLVKFTMGDNISNIKYKRPEEFLINRKHWDESGISVIQIELSCLLVSAALTGEHYQPKLTFPDDGWLIMAVRLWSAELFASDNISFRSFFDDKFYPNALAPFNGIRLGAGINNRKKSISHGLGMAALCRFLFSFSDKKLIGEIFESTTKEKGVTTTLIEKIIEKMDYKKNEWWPYFLRLYVELDNFLLNFLYAVEASVFVQTVDDIWNISESKDTLKVFSSDNANVGQYPDLSAKRFLINLKNSNLAESKDLVITIEEADGSLSTDLTTICFSNDPEYNSNFFLDVSTNGVLRLEDLKGFYDIGSKQLLVVAVNSKGEPPYKSYSDINLKMKIEDHVDEFDYTKCWAKVKLGSATYLKTNLTTESSFNSSTSGQSFGQITYEGSFSYYTFIGNFEQISKSGSSTDTISGTISVSLNESKSIVTDIKLTQIIKSYNSNSNSSNYWDIEFNGQNIPIEDENDPSTFVIKGSQTCSSISSLYVFHRSLIPNDPNNNYEETLQSYQCNLGGEEITIYFSK